MVILRATRKILEKLKVAPATVLPPSSGFLPTWYADLLTVNRRQYVQLFNEETCACVVIAWTEFKADPLTAFRTHVRGLLENAGLPKPLIDAEMSHMSVLTITKTQSKATIGRMIRFAEVAQFGIEDGRPLEQVSASSLGYLYLINRDRAGASAIHPIDLLRQRFAVESTDPLQRVKPMTDTYILRIALDGIRPEIWRTVMVPTNITLGRLHKVFQSVMGWDDAHLHLFQIKDREYGETSHFTDLPDIRSDRSTTLVAFNFAPGDTFGYLYDMGDSWQHTVTVIGTDRVDPSTAIRLLDGANACPPEDVGGLHGFAWFVLAMMDPAHADHDEVMQWHGRYYDHTMFDLNTTQKLLAAVAP